MNQPDKSASGPLDRQWWSKRRVLCIILLLLAAGYIYAQPTLERWLGVELPALAERPPERDGPVGNANQSASAATNSETPDASGRFPLEKIGADTWRSPEGLVYGIGPGRQPRIDHIMRHTTDDSDRPVHGVFDAKSRDDVYTVLDEAYALVRQNSPRVRSQRNGDRTELTITMPRSIGFVGGQDGARQNRPRTDRLKLILEDDQVITAYPVWPRR